MKKLSLLLLLSVLAVSCNRPQVDQSQPTSQNNQPTPNEDVIQPYENHTFTYTITNLNGDCTAQAYEGGNPDFADNPNQATCSGADYLKNKQAVQALYDLLQQGKTQQAADWVNKDTKQRALLFFGGSVGYQPGPKMFSTLVPYKKGLIAVVDLNLDAPEYSFAYITVADKNINMYEQYFLNGVGPDASLYDKLVGQSPNPKWETFTNELDQSMKSGKFNEPVIQQSYNNFLKHIESATK